MQVIVSLLRGVNVGRHARISMDALRALYESLGFKGARTYVQSGNVVFRTRERDLARLEEQIETAIEGRFGFPCAVILRTADQMRAVAAQNPFAGRSEVIGGRLLVFFLAGDPAPEALQKVLAIPAEPEELRIDGSHLYVHFPNGMSQARLNWPAVDKALGVPMTGRNWNTVTRLLAMAEEMEAG